MKNISILLLALTCCVSPPKPEVTGVPTDPRVRLEQEGELKKADGAFDGRDFLTAEKLYAQFRVRFPSSIFYQRAQFGLAHSLEEQGRWSEAAELYRLTVEATQDRQKDIAAQALFELSFCYESLGDEARVLASLVDAVRLKDYLSSEQIMAEVPARLAASYQRMGRAKESEAALKGAEAGIFEIQSKRGGEANLEWLAQIYSRMGSFSTNQVAYENLQAHLDTLKMVQIFSLRSGEASGEPWSSVAIQRLMENYRDLWNTIQQIPLNRAMNVDAARREQSERQIHFAGELLSLINDLNLNRMPENKEPTGSVKKLFTYLKKIEAQGKELLISFGEQSVLTVEAQKRQSLKREGVTLKPLKSSNEDSAEKKLPEKDPNL